MFEPPSLFSFVCIIVCLVDHNSNHGKLKRKMAKADNKKAVETQTK